MFSHKDVKTFEVSSAFLLCMIDLCLILNELSCTWDTSVNQSLYSTSCCKAGLLVRIVLDLNS